MYGKGRPSPITSGVRAGKIWRAKSESSSSRSSSEAESAEISRIPCSASVGRRSRCTQSSSRFRSPMTRSWMASMTSAAAIPSAPRASSAASTWSCRPATRTMKNSSRFDS